MCMCVIIFSKALLASRLLLINVYPNEAVDSERGVYYTMRHQTVSRTVPHKHYTGWAKTTRSTQPCFPSRVAKSSTASSGVRAGMSLLPGGRTRFGCKEQLNLIL